MSRTTKMKTTCFNSINMHLAAMCMCTSYRNTMRENETVTKIRKKNNNLIEKNFYLLSSLVNAIVSSFAVVLD